MRITTNQHLSRLTAVIVLCALLLPSVAWGAPTAGSQAEIDAKKAAQDSTTAALQQSQLELNIKTAEYIEGARELERTQAEISEVTTQIAELDTSVLRAETALVQRAVELYRGDRLGLIALLLDARSIADFMTRANYLVAINGRDAQMVTGLRQARAESAWLHEHLAERIARLETLQAATEAQVKDLEKRAEEQEKKAAELGEDLAELQRRVREFAGGEASGYFNPDTIISDANYRDVNSMTTDEIQAFLEGKPGVLGTYRAKDHNGTMKSAAEMIAEAALNFDISPKVILATLQKESSLVEKHIPSHYRKAMGAGWGDSYTNLQYDSFGKQIWWGTQKLDNNAGSWRPGIERTIDGNVVRPTNVATWSLYKYTPHRRGNESFWKIYWRYFGDPVAASTARP